MATEARLRETLFGRMPFARVLLAERAGEAVGFALYYFRYSSFAAQPSLWLDDLFVTVEARSQSIGTRLMACLAQEALTTGCSHMAWTAGARNTDGLRFYDRLGGRVIERKGEVLYYRLDGDNLREIAADPSGQAQTGIEVIMPKMWETMSEGKVVSWRKQEGVIVSIGQVIGEIETDKSLVEIEAEAGGMLHILVQPGQTVPIGQAIAIIRPIP